MNKLLILIVFLSYYLFSQNIKCVEDKAPSFLKGKIDKIVDGDTIKLKKNEGIYSIRLLNIDSPETHYLGQTQGYWGEEATKNIEGLVPIGGTVIVKFDKQACDMYGRWLGTVYYNDLDINAQQIKDGYAVLYCIYPNISNCLEYSKYMEDSIENGKSFVNDSSIMLPYLFRHNGINSKPVGNIYSYKVFDPDKIDLVPISNRVFFFKASDIRPPYFYENDTKIDER